MRKCRFMKEQIVTILKEHQAGLSAAELCKKHGISDATVQKWRSKLGGMEVVSAERLRAPGGENGGVRERPGMASGPQIEYARFCHGQRDTDA